MCEKAPSYQRKQWRHNRGEKLFANDSRDKGLISKRFKDLKTSFNSKESKLKTCKWSEQTLLEETPTAKNYAKKKHTHTSSVPLAMQEMQNTTTVKHPGAPKRMFAVRN